MLMFDNPPEYLSIDALVNPLDSAPIGYTFNPVTGCYSRGERDCLGVLILLPLGCRVNHGADRLELLFLSKFNQLGLLTLDGHQAADLYQCLQILKLRQLKPYAAWLCMNRQFLQDARSWRACVSSYYWASKWDCVKGGSIALSSGNVWEALDAK